MRGGALTPQFRLVRGEGFLHAPQHGLDPVSAPRIGGASAKASRMSSGAIPVSAILWIHSRRIMP